MRIEFVSPYDHNPATGIGRYIYTLRDRLGRYEDMDVAIQPPRLLPLTHRFSSIRNLPIGIEGHVPGSIVHFPQIMGCAMMLYRPYHPSVATVHDLGLFELPEEGHTLDPIGRRLLNWSLAGLKRVDKIVAVSEFTRRGVIKHLGIPEDRVVTIHSGIDHELFRPMQDARARLCERFPRLASIAPAPWLLYVGSELPRKDMGALLQAVALVREVMPGVRLIKVGAAGGEPFRRETLSVIDKLSLKDSVLFFEGVTEEELALFYNAANVFVTASKLEGFGFPVLEALACGTPVVCSKIETFEELLPEFALYADASDPFEFADQITAVLKGSTHVGGTPSERVEFAQRYNWPASVAKLMTVYESLADKAPLVATN